MRLTKWWPFRSDLPTHATEKPIDVARKNLQALAVLSVAGIDHGWSYTNSVTRAQASPGTAAEPAIEYYFRGTGNTTQWVKRVLTWAGGVITKAAFYYSADNEATYVPLTDDESNNYVLTLTYSGTDIASTSWGNTP